MVKTATITNGKNGIDAPAISVKKDGDGLYYWTLDGDFILVDGEKIKAQGVRTAPPDRMPCLEIAYQYRNQGVGNVDRQWYYMDFDGCQG